jgi:small conductance mechanosensitive channel
MSCRPGHGSARFGYAGRAMTLARLLLLLLLSAPAAHAAPAALPAASPGNAAEFTLGPRLVQVDGLAGVRVRQVGGVLILEGEVLSEADRELAEKIARGADGVRDVINHIEVSMDLRARIAASTRESLRTLERFVGRLPLLLVAVLLVGAAWWISRWLARRHWLLRPVHGNPFVADLLRHAIRIGGVLLGLILALQLLDAVALAGALLGSAGILGIALGFAFKDTVENYIASILLSLRKPFDANDHVVIDGNEGVVVGLNSRATVLMTPAGNHLRLPNSMVFKAVTLNYSRNPHRRFDFTMELAPDSSATTVLEQGLAELKSVPGVLDTPAPAVVLQRAGRNVLEVLFLGWADQRVSNFGWVRSEAIRRVRSRLRRHGVPFSGPSMTLQRSATAAVDDDPRALHGPVPQSDTAALAPAVEASRADMGDSDLLPARGPSE